MLNEKHKQTAPEPSAHGRTNTLGLTGRDLDHVLDTFDAQDEGSRGSWHRQYVRRSFRRLTVPLQLSQCGGGFTQIRVACRNLSRTGISVLHRSYLHVSTLCQVDLERIDGRTQTVKGKIAWCRHRTGAIHEIGISFDQPVDVKELMESGMFSDWFSLERVDPGQLMGTLLFVDDCEADRRLLRHHLRDTSMSVTTSETGKAGVQRALDGFDIIVCDYHLGDMDACGFVSEIREAGVRSPVIVVTCDTSSAVPQKLAKANAQAYLAKPIDRNLLMRALAEFLQLDEKVGAQLSCTSTLPPGSPNSPLVDEYVADLHAAATFFMEAIARGDHRACWRKAGEIKGVAPALGFAALAELAEKAMTALTASASVEESAMELKRLSDACARAQARRTE